MTTYRWGDVIRRLGHLTDYDKATLAQLWRTVYTF